MKKKKKKKKMKKKKKKKKTDSYLQQRLSRLALSLQQLASFLASVQPRSETQESTPLKYP